MVGAATAQRASNEPKEQAIVIGAGVAGLQAVRALTKAGIPVTCLELQERVGGVWTRETHGYTLQVPWQMYEFPEFPLPSQLAPKAQCATSQELAAYLHAYAQQHDLHKYIQLRSRVLQVVQTGAGKGADTSTGAGWLVRYEDVETGTQFQLQATWLLVCTGQMATPFVPQYKGKEDFLGKILHSGDLMDLSVFKDKKVVVVGSGKTGLDLVAEMGAASHAQSVTLVYRTSHWCLPRKLKGQPMSDFLLSRNTSQQLPPYYTRVGPTGQITGSHGLGCMPCGQSVADADDGMDAVTSSVASGNTVAGSSAACRLLTPSQAEFWQSVAVAARAEIHTPKLAAPNLDLLQDLFHGAQIFDAGWCKFMASDKVTAHQGTIARMNAQSVVLSDGQEVPCDVLLCCTGYHNDYRFLDNATLAALNVSPDGLYLYRSMIPPHVPRLAFLGSEVSTFNQLMTTFLQVAWLVRVIMGATPLPPTSDMQLDVVKQQSWRRRIMPAARSRACVYMLYQQHYYDQLVGDMGEQVRGKPWWRLGSNLHRACTPADYAHLLTSAPRAPTPAAPMEPAHVEKVPAEKLQRTGTGILAPNSEQGIQDVLLSVGKDDAPGIGAASSIPVKGTQPQAHHSGAAAGASVWTIGALVLDDGLGAAGQAVAEGQEAPAGASSSTQGAIGAGALSHVCNSVAEDHAVVSDDIPAPRGVTVASERERIRKQAMGNGWRAQFRRWSHDRSVPNKEKVAAASKAAGRASLDTATAQLEAAAMQPSEGGPSAGLPIGTASSYPFASGVDGGDGDLKPRISHTGVFKQWLSGRNSGGSSSSNSGAAAAAPAQVSRAKQIFNKLLTGSSGSSSNKSVKGGNLSGAHSGALGAATVAMEPAVSAPGTPHSNLGGSDAAGTFMLRNGSSEGNARPGAGSAAVTGAASTDFPVSVQPAPSTPTAEPQSVSNVSVRDWVRSKDMAGHSPASKTALQLASNSSMQLPSEDAYGHSSDSAGMQPPSPLAGPSTLVGNFRAPQHAAAGAAVMLGTQLHALAQPGASALRRPNSPARIAAAAAINSTAAAGPSCVRFAGVQPGAAAGSVGPAAAWWAAQPPALTSLQAAVQAVQPDAAAAAPVSRGSQEWPAGRVRLTDMDEVVDEDRHNDAALRAAVASDLHEQQMSAAAAAAARARQQAAGMATKQQQVQEVQQPAPQQQVVHMQDQSQRPSPVHNFSGPTCSSNVLRRLSGRLAVESPCITSQLLRLSGSYAADGELSSNHTDDGAGGPGHFHQPSGERHAQAVALQAMAEVSPPASGEAAMVAMASHDHATHNSSSGSGDSGAQTTLSGRQSAAAAAAVVLAAVVVPDGAESVSLHGLANPTSHTLQLQPAGPPEASAARDVWGGEWASVTSNVLNHLGPGADATNASNVQDGADVQTAASNVLRRLSWRLGQGYSRNFVSGANAMTGLDSGSLFPAASGNLQAASSHMMLYTPILGALLQARASAPSVPQQTSAENAAEHGMVSADIASSTSDNDKVTPLPDVVSRSYMSLGSASAGSVGLQHGHSPLFTMAANRGLGTAHTQRLGSAAAHQNVLASALARSGRHAHQVRARARSLSAVLPVAPRVPGTTISGGGIGSGSNAIAPVAARPVRAPTSTSRLGQHSSHQPQLVAPMTSAGHLSRLHSSSSVYLAAETPSVPLPGQVVSPYASRHNAEPAAADQLAAVMAARASNGGGVGLGELLVSDYMLLLRELGVFADGPAAQEDTAAAAVSGGFGALPMTPGSPVMPAMRGWAPVVPGKAGGGTRAFAIIPGSGSVPAPHDDAVGGISDAVCFGGGDGDRVLDSNALLRLSGRVIPSGYNALDGCRDGCGAVVGPSAVHAAFLDSQPDMLMRLSGRVLPSEAGFARVADTDAGRYNTAHDYVPQAHDLNMEQMLKEELQSDAWDARYLALSAPMPFTVPPSCHAAAAAPTATAASKQQGPSSPQRQRRASVTFASDVGGASASTAHGHEAAGQQLHRRLCDALMAREVVRGLMAELHQLPERVVSAAAAARSATGTDAAPATSAGTPDGAGSRPVSVCTEPADLEALREALQHDINQLPHRLAAALAPSLVVPAVTPPPLPPVASYQMAAGSTMADMMGLGVPEEIEAQGVDSRRLYSRLEGRVLMTPLQSGSNALGYDSGFDPRAETAIDAGLLSPSGVSGVHQLLATGSGPATMPSENAAPALDFMLGDVAALMSHISQGRGDGDQRVWADQVIAQLLLQDMVHLPDRLLTTLAHGRVGGPASLGESSGQGVTHKSTLPATPPAAATPQRVLSPGPEVALKAPGDDILDLLMMARDNILTLSAYIGGVPDLGGSSLAATTALGGNSNTSCQLMSTRSGMRPDLQRLAGRVAPSGPTSRRASVVVPSPPTPHSPNYAGPSPVSP